MGEPVYCEDCDSSSADNATRPSWRWLCLASPNKGHRGYVTRGYWDKDEPYHRCATINRDGDCTMFEPSKGDDDGA